MANNQPNVDTGNDPEYDALKTKVPGLEDEPSPDDKKSDDEKAKTDPPETLPADTGKDKGKDEEDVEDDDPADKKPSRPEKYIPIKQYVDEKATWKGTLADKENRIKELEGIVGGKDGSKKSEEAIKAYAETYGVDENSVRDLVSTIRDDIKGSLEKENKQPPKAAELTPEQQSQIDKSNEIVAQQQFDQEFTDLAVPELKSFYPNATPEQLANAKAEVEKLATTRKYLDKSLDFVIFKEHKTFAKIFASARKGPEGSQAGADKGKATLTADDFKGNKTPFSTLVELPPEEQGKIVDAMDLKTYEAFSNWVNQNDTLVINRGGRKVKP